MADLHKLALNQLMARILGATPAASLLVICRTAPEFCLAHPGPLSIICRTAIAKDMASRDLSISYYTNGAEFLACIARQGSRHARDPFDYIFFHADHSPHDLLEQLRLLGDAIDRHTVILMADAVPPDFAMAGPHPGAGWYVGEVWMLHHLLEPREPDGFVMVSKVRPTGLLAARNVALPSDEILAARYAELSRVGSGQDLEAISRYSDPEDVFGIVGSGFSRTLTRRFELVDIADETRLPTDPATGQGFVRLARSDAVPFEKPRPTFIADLSSRAYDVSGILRAPRHPHATCIDEFTDVTLLGSNTLIAGGRCFFRNLRPPISVERTNADGSFPNVVTELRAVGGRVGYPRSNAPARQVRGHHHLVTPDEQDNWGMWLIQAVPSVVDYIRNREAMDGVIAYLKFPWQQAFLRHFGLTGTEITRHDVQRRYVVDRLRVVRHGFRDLILRDDEREMYRWVAERLSRDVTSRSPERIFLSRRSRSAKGSYRALLNEDELIAALERLGFVAVEPETLSLPEQAAMLDRAKAIVGLGGAAMFNLVFARPDTPVVTIESTPGFLDAHTNLIASMTRTYGVILGEVDESDPRPSQKRWTLDVPRAAEAIRAFFG